MDELNVIGIDLGTTYSAIASVNDLGMPVIIENREGERITPSVVLFDGKTPLVGSLAKNSGKAAPLNICQFVKRQMGAKDWRFTAEDFAEYTAEEVSAVILKKLKEDAEEHLGRPILGAAITVPAYFNDAQRTATRDAARLADIEVFRILNEPTAAALAYGCRPGRKKERILVYDLGGGTFDVTIMDTGEEDLEVIATHGDPNLGGFNWDNVLMTLLTEKFEKATGIVYPEDPLSLHDLREKAEIAKKTLTSRASTRVFLAAGDQTKAVELTREEFERNTDSLLKRTADILEMTIDDASTSWREINTILLVGGSTRMPMVSQLLERTAGRTVSSDMNVDEAVALGAAISADLVSRERFPSRESMRDRQGGAGIKKVSDVISHSLGVVIVDDSGSKKINSIIVSRNTKTPASEKSTYQTIVDSQSSIHLEVTEGEEEDLEFVRIIGSAEIKLPAYPKGAPIEVAIGSNEDGRLEISVWDLTANKTLHDFKIERISNRSDREIMEMKQQFDSLAVG